MKEGRKVKIEELTNNKLRTQFIEGYKTWDVFCKNVLTGEKIYWYPLDFYVAIAVKSKEYHNYKEELAEGKEEYFLLNVKVRFDGKKNTFVIDDETTFYDCVVQKSTVIEFIKEYQRVGGNLKLTGRAELRGKLLDEDCKKAKISSNECGPKDTRKFCYGLTDMSTEEPLQKCKECGAYVNNVTPL